MGAGPLQGHCEHVLYGAWIPVNAKRLTINSQELVLLERIEFHIPKRIPLISLRYFRSDEATV
jgi:hypothetical protein